MPTRVVAVRRSKRGAFELIRRAPTWFRALVVTVRNGRSASVTKAPVTKAPVTNAPLPDAPLPNAPRTGQPRIPGLLALERASGLAVPRWEAGGDSEACSDCAQCVDICPSNALALRRPGGPSSASSASSSALWLSAGSCIGCGDCALFCPENLLVMAPSGSRAGLGPAPVPIDLVEASKAHDSGAAIA